jgi:hypothetical protein
MSSLDGDGEGGQSTEEQEGAEKPTEETQTVAPNLEKITEQQREFYRERQKMHKEMQELRSQLEQMKTKKPEEKEEEGDSFEDYFKKLMAGDEEKNKGKGEEEDEDRPLTKKEMLQMWEEKEKKNRELEEKNIKEMEVEIQVEKFKTKILGEVSKVAETSPVLAMIGGNDDQVETIYDLIDQDYRRNVEEFGEEYAGKNIMTVEAAIKQTENYLATQLKTMITSNKGYRSLLVKLLGEAGETSESSSTQPNTLTNSLAGTADASNNLDDDEARINRAIAAAEKAWSNK